MSKRVQNPDFDIDVTAIQIAHLSAGCYSTFFYRSWVGVARALLKRGLHPEDALIVLCSKLPRRAVDAHDYRYGCYPAKVLVELLDECEAYSGSLQPLLDELREEGWAEDVLPTLRASLRDTTKRARARREAQALIASFAS